eukprot:TRINITY_DN6310_c0_g1_i2.p1 TRINITY_DN6310_c0_g1~~TRINITY_DN6310_c0_g1_i2.p1  ORF type:complete len:295 (-),score=52.30 TRINITY_DN6310_c0_g1_i2:351-1235(-)
MVQDLMHRRGEDSQAMRRERMHIPETVQDLWHRHGVATEILENYKVVEQRALTPTVQANHLLAAQLRGYAIECMKCIMMKLGISPLDWSQAVSLLDTYVLKAAWDTPMLPVTCACMIQLVKKFSKQETVPVDDLACLMSQVMVIPGIEMREITEEVLISHELTICQAINWQIDVMTVDRWILMFFTRFEILTGNALQMNIKETMFKVTHMLIMGESASLQFSHYNVALGVFFIGFAAVHLIPEGPEGTLMQEVIASTIGILEAVTCSQLPIIEQAAHAVTQALTAMQRRQLAAA